MTDKQKKEERLSAYVFLGGIVLLMVVIMAMSSCGSTNKCSNNKMVKQYSNW